MKAYRTTRDFVWRVWLDNKGHAPKFTCYEVEDWQHARRFQQRAPNSYHGLRRVTFWADGRCVTRRFGTWVESADKSDETWLMQRQLRAAVDRLRDKDLRRPFLESSRNVDPEVKTKLDRYLDDARWNLYEEFNRKVIAEATRLMRQDCCFIVLEARGDLLDQAVA